jgi:glucose-6-phosphate dehydrogenase assembly protein OpcA
MGKRENDCICISAKTKCWWHGLKDVKVISSKKIDENVCFNTILDSSPAYAPESEHETNITFRLEF